MKNTMISAALGLLAVAGLVVLGLVGFAYARRTERGLERIGRLRARSKIT